MDTRLSHEVRRAVEDLDRLGVIIRGDDFRIFGFHFIVEISVLSQPVSCFEMRCAQA